jgi:hypothetical protein
MSVITKALKYTGTSSKAVKSVKKTARKAKSKSETVVGAPSNKSPYYKGPYSKMGQELDAADSYKRAKKAHSSARSEKGSKLTGLAKEIAAKSASSKSGTSKAFKKATDAIESKGFKKGFENAKRHERKKVTRATVAVGAGTAGYVAGKSQGKKK